MPKYEQVVISFGGRPLIVQRKVETVAEMMQRCREADEARIAAGTQDAFLKAQHGLPAADWRDRSRNEDGDMATIADDTGTAPQTQADRIRERGGANQSPTALEIMHQRELKQRALKADTKISEEYRREQLAALDAEADTALWADRDATLAAKKEPLEQARGSILAEILGTTDAKNLAETASESAERHHKAMRAALELQNDLTLATSADDPDVLADLLEETLLASNKIERARKLAPVIMARLTALSAAKTAGANAAWARATTQYSQFKKQHPSRPARLRDADARLARVEPEVDRQYDRLRESFRFGRHAQGIRM